MESSGSSVRVRLLPDELALLMALGDEGSPVGARIALRALSNHGVTTSEASVSRMLGKLDSLGLTSRLGQKGRVLTEAGTQMYQSQRAQLRRSVSFDRALELRTITELQDWLRARRVIEAEAASLAAHRHTPPMIGALTNAVESHERAAIDGNLGFRTVGMDFHVLITQAAQSPIFEALTESLMSSKVERVEQALDFITASRGTMGDSVAEHRQLLDAITSGDSQAARERMSAHLARLEREVDQFADSADGAALLTALSAMGSLGGPKQESSHESGRLGRPGGCEPPSITPYIAH